MLTSQARRSWWEWRNEIPDIMFSGHFSLRLCAPLLFIHCHHTHLASQMLEVSIHSLPFSFSQAWCVLLCPVSFHMNILRLLSLLLTNASFLAVLGAEHKVSYLLGIHCTACHTSSPDASFQKKQVLVLPCNGLNLPLKGSCVGTLISNEGFGVWHQCHGTEWWRSL
jgi:hypothetical protein